jgi:hypothetical protein
MVADENDVIADDDDNIVLNMNEVEDLKFEALPRGEYDAVIELCEYKRSQASNKPMWSVRLEIEGGDYAGRKVYTNLSFSEGALPGTKLALKTFLTEEEFTDFHPKALADNGDMLGRKVRVKLDIETYQGNKQNKVKRWLTPKAVNEFIA